MKLTSENATRILNDLIYFQNHMGYTFVSIDCETQNDKKFYVIHLKKPKKTSISDWWENLKWKLFGEIKILFWLAGVYIFCILSILGGLGYFIYYFFTHYKHI